MTTASSSCVATKDLRIKSLYQFLWGTKLPDKSKGRDADKQHPFLYKRQVSKPWDSYGLLKGEEH